MEKKNNGIFALVGVLLAIILGLLVLVVYNEINRDYGIDCDCSTTTCKNEPVVSSNKKEDTKNNLAEGKKYVDDLMNKLDLFITLEQNQENHNFNYLNNALDKYYLACSFFEFKSMDIDTDNHYNIDYQTFSNHYFQVIGEQFDINKLSAYNSSSWTLPVVNNNIIKIPTYGYTISFIYKINSFSTKDGINIITVDLVNNWSGDDNENYYKAYEEFDNTKEIDDKYIDSQINVKFSIDNGKYSIKSITFTKVK